MSDRIYWHGGPAGRSRGGRILPSSVTGAPSTRNFGAVTVCRADRVYLTTSYAAAVLYAAGHKRGVVYRCEPIGEVEPDPDCNTPGLSWQCEAATVMACVKPRHWEIAKCRQALLEGMPD